MKKTTSALFAIALVSLLASCSTNDAPSTEVYEIECGNIFSDPNGNVVQVFPGKYRFSYNLTEGNVTVSTENLHIGNMQYDFSMEMPYSVTIYGNGDIRTFSSGASASAGNYTFFNFKGNAIALYSFSPSTGVNLGTRRTVNMTYYLGDHRIAVFDINPFFGGTTQTEYTSFAGKETTFDNEEPVYAVNINPATKKASVYFYNARFAREMPVKISFVIEDLDVVFSETGYTISGNNLVPQVAEGNGGVTTPNPNYTFDSFRLTAYGENFNNALIEYSVAGKYSGRCDANQFVLKE